MKKVYTLPEFDVILLTHQDILTTSTEPEVIDLGDNSGGFQNP